MPIADVRGRYPCCPAATACSAPGDVEIVAPRSVGCSVSPRPAGRQCLHRVGVPANGRSARFGAAAPSPPPTWCALSAHLRSLPCDERRPALEIRGAPRGSRGARRCTPRFREDAVLPADHRRRPASERRAPPRWWRQAAGTPVANRRTCFCGPAVLSTQPWARVGGEAVLLEQAALVGEHDCLDTIPDAELGDDARDVGLDGCFADDQLRGDLCVGEASRD